LDIPEQAQMEGDRAEIEIIFNNLISNAVKYNRDGGQVDVSARTSSDEIIIQVRDTGIGLTEEESKRLFSDFCRIKNEKTRHILGSGLGLSTVKKIVNLYHGDITVESQPDVGSTFTVVLRPTGKVVQ
jgi:signal transduction histidine kinase